MQIGMVGLGRMGANMVRRLIRGGHECIVFNRTQERVKELVKEGAIGAASLEELVATLKPPRAVWMIDFSSVGWIIAERQAGCLGVLSRRGAHAPGSDHPRLWAERDAGQL